MMMQGTSSMDTVLEKPRGLTRRAKLWLAAGAVALAGVVLAIPTIGRWARAERVVDISRLRLATVTRGDLTSDLAVPGTIAAALRPRLYSPARGIVTLHTRAGEAIRKGQLLMTVDSPELESRLEQEQAALASLVEGTSRQEIAGRQSVIEMEQQIELAEVRAAAARRELERSQRLFDEGLLNKTDFETAQDAVTIADVELRNARQTLELTKDTVAVELRNMSLQADRQRSVARDLQRQVEELSVTAPFDGLVATVDVQDRDAVAFNQPLLMVVNLTTYEVRIGVPEAYADEVGPGTTAEILVEGGTWRGEVTSISPEVRQGEVEATVAFAPPVPPGLKQNQRVSVRLLLAESFGVLKVSRGPFLESGGSHKVYVVKDGLATLREITVGALSVGEVEILSGLAEGEQIVLSDIARFEGARTVLVNQ